MQKIANTTFLFTDVEGSTRRWQASPAQMREMLAHHNALLREEIGRFGGKIFKSTGDGYCAVFSSVVEAANSACSIQQALTGLEWKPNHGDDLFRVRIAIHCGESELIGEDYFGLALAETQRLMSAGHGGQILLSRAAASDLRQHEQFDGRLRDLGFHRLRDLQQSLEIFQLDEDVHSCEFPPLRTLEEYANNLPRQLTRFIGRREQVVELKSLFLQYRLVTITGPGGCGKSRLSIQVAAEIVHYYTGGAFLVELAGLTNPNHIPSAIAAVLRIPDNREMSGIESVIAGIGTESYLIVLDNCEHLIYDCAEIAKRIINSCPHVHILATSREPLGITGEIVRPLSGLPVPAPNPPANIDDLFEIGSVQLLSDRIAAITPSFRLSNENAPFIVQICRSLDGIPLALELAAARCSALSVEQLAGRMNDRFRLLTQGSRTALPRQQTLRALIDWSYDLLADAEQKLLVDLSVFSGGWTLEAAEAVCDVDEAVSDVLTNLSRLVEKSLVVLDPATEPPRYRLLETLKAYAQEKLTAASEADFERIQKYHFRYFLQFGAMAKQHLQGSRQAEWMDRISADHDNIRAALAYGVEHDLAGALELATNIYWFWYTRGYQREWRGWFDTALLQSSPVPPDIR